MNFSTKLSLLNLLLIFSMAVPSKAMMDKAIEAPEQVAAANTVIALLQDASQLANQSNPYVKAIKDLPAKAGQKVSALFKEAKELCPDAQQLFALIKGEKITLVVLTLDATYIAKRGSDAGFKLIPMSDVTRQKYKTLITTGKVLITGTAGILTTILSNRYKTIVGPRASNAIAFTLAVVLACDNSYVRGLLTQVPAQIKKAAEQMKRIPGLMRQVPGVIRNNPKRTALVIGGGAGLTGLAIGLKRLGMKGLNDIINNNVMPILSKCSATLKKNPKTAGIAAGFVLASLGLVYKFGFQKNLEKIKSQLQEINAAIVKGNLSQEQKAALRSKLEALKTAITTTVTNVNKQAQEKQQEIVTAIVLPCNALLREVGTLTAKLN